VHSQEDRELRSAPRGQCSGVYADSWLFFFFLHDKPAPSICLRRKAGKTQSFNSDEQAGWGVGCVEWTSTRGNPLPLTASLFSLLSASVRSAVGSAPSRPVGVGVGENLPLKKRKKKKGKKKGKDSGPYHGLSCHAPPIHGRHYFSFILFFFFFSSSSMPTFRCTATQRNARSHPQTYVRTYMYVRTARSDPRSRAGLEGKKEEKKAEMAGLGYASTYVRRERAASERTSPAEIIDMLCCVQPLDRPQWVGEFPTDVSRYRTRKILGSVGFR